MRKSALLIVAAVGLTATTAYADPPPCSALPDEPDAANPIPKLYIENGDTQEPMITKMGQLLIKSANPIRVIYRNRPTCNLRVDLYTGANMTKVTDGTTARTVKYIQFDTTQPPVECSVPDLTTDPNPNPAPVKIQLGIGATFLSSCTDTITNPDASVDQFAGPVLAYGFITHPQSSQNGITYEEGYLAYGFPEGDGQANPWIVQALRFKRSNTASTSLTMAANVGLPSPAKMQAAPALVPETSAQLALAVEGSSNPEATLGILGMDLRDSGNNRTLIKMLPFKAKNQRYAYYPDKTKDSYDRQNVRDGHYMPWAPTPYIASKAGDGTIADPLAKRFYDLVMGNNPSDDVNGLKVISQVGLVPQCAMKVTRTADGSDLSRYTTDPHPCGCYFEANVPQGAASASCTTCTDDTTCSGATPKCRFGYCEAR